MDADDAAHVGAVLVMLAGIVVAMWHRRSEERRP